MNKEKTVSRLFLILTAAYVTCLLLSNLIAGKLWAVADRITLPAAVVLFPVTYILGDVFTEVYGFKKARTVIWLGFSCSFFAVAVYLLTVALPYPSYFTAQESYRTVLGTTPRVALASFTGYLFGEFSNSMILSRMKVMTEGKHLWARTIFSTVVGEGFDSILFIMISFFGTMPMRDLWNMILFQYLFKVLYEVLFTPVTYAAVKRVKKEEQTDVYDHNTRYSVIGGER